MGMTNIIVTPLLVQLVLATHDLFEKNQPASTPSSHYYVRKSKDGGFTVNNGVSPRLTTVRGEWSKFIVDRGVQDDWTPAEEREARGDRGGWDWGFGFWFPVCEGSDNCDTRGGTYDCFSSKITKAVPECGKNPSATEAWQSPRTLDPFCMHRNKAVDEQFYGIEDDNGVVDTAPQTRVLEKDYWEEVSVQIPSDAAGGRNFVPQGLMCYGFCPLQNGACDVAAMKSTFVPPPGRHSPRPWVPAEMFDPGVIEILPRFKDADDFPVMVRSIGGVKLHHPFVNQLRPYDASGHFNGKTPSTPHPQRTVPHTFAPASITVPVEAEADNAGVTLKLDSVVYESGAKNIGRTVFALYPCMQTMNDCGVNGVNDALLCGDARPQHRNPRVSGYFDERAAGDGVCTCQNRQGQGTISFKTEGASFFTPGFLRPFDPSSPDDLVLPGSLFDRALTRNGHSPRTEGDFILCPVLQSDALTGPEASISTPSGSGLILKLRFDCSSNSDCSSRAGTNVCNAAADREQCRQANQCRQISLSAGTLPAGQTGVCINAEEEEVCGTTVFDKMTEKCCSPAEGLVYPNNVWDNQERSLAWLDGNGPAATADPSGASFCADNEAYCNQLGGTVGAQPPTTCVAPQVWCGKANAFAEFNKLRTAGNGRNPPNDRASSRLIREYNGRPQFPCPCMVGSAGNGNSLSYTCARPNEACCSGTTQTNFVTRDAATTSGNNQWDMAYNPLFASSDFYSCYDTTNFECSDDAHIFNPGLERWCPLTNLQPIEKHCPCLQDSHCSPTSGGGNNDNMKCCFQNFPQIASLDMYQQTCNKYANWDPVLDRFFDAQLSFLRSFAHPTWEGRTDDIRAELMTAISDPHGSSNGYQPIFNQIGDQCPGKCIDVTYQACCNGAVCANDYESCCNSTCCNKFTAKCESGKKWRQDSLGRAGAGAFSNDFFSDRDFQTDFAVCTEIEALSITRAFWVYILPGALIFFTIAGVGMVWTFALRATDQGFKLEDAQTPSNTCIGKLLWAAGTLQVVFAVFMYFSPQFSYGVLTAIGGLFLITVVASKVKWLYTFAALYQLFLVLLYVDPFSGNALLNMGHMRNGVEMYRDGGPNTVGTPPSPIVAGNDQPYYVSRTLWHNIALNNPSSLLGFNTEATDNFPQQLRTGRHTFRSFSGLSICAQFYEYFEYDPSLLDLDREDNSHDRFFGYCSRSWTMVLLVVALVEIVLIVLSVALLVVLIVSRILSDKNFKYSYDPNAYDYVHNKDKIVGAVGFE